MNKSTITRLENKYDILISYGTVQVLNGNWLRMTFDILTDTGTRYVSVKANEPIYKAIERTLNK